jgi:two-component system response regulator HydG
MKYWPFKMVDSPADFLNLVEFEPASGEIRVAGNRMLIWDAAAFGLLRKELIQILGEHAARTLLTRFGYAHGRHLAEVIMRRFPDAGMELWGQLGPELFRLQGLLKRQAMPPGGPMAPEGVTFDFSYEAEQHLMHVGQSDGPVCWTVAGLGSGYASRCMGTAAFAFEDRCVGKGDPACHFVFRKPEDLDESQRTQLTFFETDSLDRAIAEMAGALRQTERKLRARRLELARIAPELPETGGVVARSAAMRRVLDIATRVAHVDSTVLITGETGTGKEVVARWIHEKSPRAAAQFVAINCAAVSQSLIESELFGHVRGAFTGATQDRIGLFEAAHGGTLFLDEVGELPAATQAALLRTIQEREIRRVGENAPRRIDVRVLAATNRELARDLDEGRFRKDLYYRLRVVELNLPPLRDRREDIIPLAQLFLSRRAAAPGRALGMSPRAVDQLLRYSWPGNVRELENAVERASALAQGKLIEPDDLPEEVRGAAPGPILGAEIRKLAEIEMDYILAVLERLSGNQTQAAKMLGIGTTTLYRKLRDHDKDGAAQRFPKKR